MMGTKFLEWFIKIWLVLAFVFAFMLTMVSPFVAMFAMVYWWCM